MPRDESSQVEVQAPPGLGVPTRAPSMLSSSQVSEQEEAFKQEVAREVSEQDENFKQELVREVTEAVTEQLDAKTSAAVEALWRKGQRALCQMQQQQLDQSSKLQRQLEECTAAHQRLEQESTMLRSQLETLVSRLQMVFAAPHGPPPFIPPGVAPPSACHTPSGSERATDIGASPPSTLSSRPTTEPLGSAGDAGSETGSVIDASLKAAGAAKATSFSLTLRRASGVPLGLDVAGALGSAHLTVKAVKPGGAAEAWNKQCAGDSKEIRVEDRIIKVNDAEEAEEMREECRRKLLLKLTILRGSAEAATARSEAPPANPEPNGMRGGLRVDAREFIPQAGCV